ncbi:MAG TPA: serine/threonine-protein kinase [Gemmatimonadaceae bacterium]
MADVSARIADRFEVIRPLGRGSFAQTLLARELSQDRLVAIKSLHPRVVTEWKTIELFEREVTTLRGLRHHGVPVVYETFRANWNDGDTSFLVMEYIEGPSLAQIITERRHLDTAEVLHLFDEMLGVLDYLHTRMPPVLHRDIKPSNIIVRADGSPVLVDFGAVRSVFREPDESGSTVTGTYGYMPYEQLMGQASPASDLYALAATFLHLMTGRAPPDFMSEAGRLEVPASLPAGATFQRVLGRMLAPAPAERYRSARDVRAALLGAGESSSGTTAVTIARTTSLAPLSLGPAPRPITGEAKMLLERTSHSMWTLMSPKEKPAKWGFSEIALAAVFSLLSAGILPAVFFSMARARKRRMRDFITHGIPTTARVLEMTLDDVAFEVKMTRVRYEFEVDGQQFRDADQVLTWIAERWDRGTPIQILYIPDRDYDSVIVSTS